MLGSSFPNLSKVTSCFQGELASLATFAFWAGVLSLGLPLRQRQVGARLRYFRDYHHILLVSCFWGTGLS